MSKRSCAVGFLFLLLPLSGFATFENVAGTYTINSCVNLGKRASENICQYKTMVIHPSPRFGTALFFFSGELAQDSYIRSYGFPTSTRNEPHAQYFEYNNSMAGYVDDSPDYQQVTVISRTEDGSYHLTLFRRSESFKSDDCFEINLKKISENAPDLPSTGSDDDAP